MSKNASNNPRLKVIYSTYYGALYGSDRMILTTMKGLTESFDTLILAPRGGIHSEANRRSIPSRSFRSLFGLILELCALLKKHSTFVFLSACFTHSIIFIFLNLFYRRSIAHIDVTHGVPEIGNLRSAYYFQRRKLLASFGVRFIAVSDLVKRHLISHGIQPGQIVVIDNFLDEQDLLRIPKRSKLSSPIRNVVLLSRAMPVKRLDLLLDLLDRYPVFSKLSFKIYGDGAELERLRKRASKKHKNVHFLGFDSKASSKLAEADLFLHLCPVEAFGLAVIEAMAARVPVLVPDQGGPSEFIEQGMNGFQFRSDDVDDLAKQLSTVLELSQKSLNRVACNAEATVTSRFSSEAGINNYRRTILMYLDASQHLRRRTFVFARMKATVQ